MSNASVVAAPARPLRALSPAAARFLGPAAAARLSESGRLARQAEARAAASAAWSRSTTLEVSDSWRRVTTQDDPGGVMLEGGRGARSVGRERLLPFDLLLAHGGGALPLFRTGPFDELAYVQRTLVAPKHEYEFLVRLDPRNHGSERFLPFGAFRLADGRALPATTLPAPVRASSAGPTTADGPGRLGGGSVERARTTLEALDLVAWAELAFTTRPEPGQVVHRYYLDRHLGAWLVRDHWRDGKRAILATGSLERTRGLIVYVDRKAA